MNATNTTADEIRAIAEPIAELAATKAADKVMEKMSEKLKDVYAKIDDRTDGVTASFDRKIEKLDLKFDAKLDKKTDEASVIAIAHQTAEEHHRKCIDQVGRRRFRLITIIVAIPTAVAAFAGLAKLFF